MHDDVAPVFAAQVLLAQGVNEHVVTNSLCRSWLLNPIDAYAAIAAAWVIADERRRRMRSQRQARS